MEQIGAIAGLSAAVCWAMASVMYARVPIGAGAMTTFKNALATVFLLSALAINAAVTKQPMFQASTAAWWDLTVSGVIGLCLADIAYFRSIQILGARRGLTLTLLTPPTTAILGHYWLEDKLTPVTLLWIFITVSGIGIVMRDRAESTPEQHLRPGTAWWGTTCALLGIFTMAVGAVILKRGTQGVGSIEGTFIRLLAASVCGALISGTLRQFREIAVLLKNRTGTAYLCSATILGTVVGVYLMLLAYKHCPTGVAATLTSTTPLFVIPVVYFAYKQRITGLAIVGACVAFGGVYGLLAGGR